MVFAVNLNLKIMKAIVGFLTHLRFGKFITVKIV